MTERSPDEKIADAVLWLGCGALVLVVLAIGAVATIAKGWMS